MNALLIIDPQNDFCNPGDENGNEKGALYVPGAELDMKRLSDWILSNIEMLNSIIVTFDTHYQNDIAHPGFWQNEYGQHPEPFTVITLNDVKEKKWTPMFFYEKTLEYFEKLEKQGEYPHTIWPEHCLIGSEGVAVYKPVYDAIYEWSKKGNFMHSVVKGTFPLSEHFGAFAAQVPFDDAPETKLNMDLINELNNFETIFVAGQAKSHCVANSIKQLTIHAPEIVKKLIILEDTMSNVPGFENIADSIYENAKKLGAKFQKTKSVN